MLEGGTCLSKCCKALLTLRVSAQSRRRSCQCTSSSLQHKRCTERKREYLLTLPLKNLIKIFATDKPGVFKPLVQGRFEPLLCVTADRLSTAHSGTGAKIEILEFDSSLSTSIIYMRVHLGHCTETVLKAKTRRNLSTWIPKHQLIGVHSNHAKSTIYTGAGRGGRTPTRLPSADFEFPENTACL